MYTSSRKDLFDPGLLAKPALHSVFLLRIRMLDSSPCRVRPLGRSVAFHRPGSQRVIAGMYVINISTSISANRKGQRFFRISFIGTLDTPVMMYRSIPIGGVSNPIMMFN